MQPQRQDLKEHFGFFLLPEFSMISFAAAVDPLRMANRMSGEELYAWHFYGLDNQPVKCSNGAVIQPTRSMEDLESIDYMFVIAGIGAHQLEQETLFKWLKRIKRMGITLGATSTGSLLLARAGLLKGKVCTIHWENRDSLQEMFPDLKVSEELYELDGNIMTCSGGLAGLDMMLQLISLRHGESLAKDVAEQCIHPNIRPAHDKQRMKMQLRLQANHPRFLKAIEMMQTHLDRVMTVDQICKQIGLSSRQLERLFKDHLGHTPAHYYMKLRLDRARHLLQQSSLSVLQVADACGFSSTSYFSRCYKQQFGKTPRNERNMGVQG